MTEFLDKMEACIPALRRYARTLTGNSERADDLVQDALERAICKQQLWSASGSLQSWLFTLLINIYRNDLRAQKRRPHLIPIDELTVDPSREPEQPVRLALAETKRALSHLPEDQKQVLLIVVLEGFSYKEAATVLDIPLGTLMSRLGRARKNLRKFIDEGTPSKESGQLRNVK